MMSNSEFHYGQSPAQLNQKKRSKKLSNVLKFEFFYCFCFAIIKINSPLADQYGSTIGAFI